MLKIKVGRIRTWDSDMKQLLKELKTPRSRGKDWKSSEDRLNWGDLDQKYRWKGSTLAHPTFLPVGTFPAGASPFGMLDMLGNAWELTDSPRRLS